MEQHDYAVFIGRFQPPHFEHISIIRGALDISDRVIIVLGGAHQSITIKNPWTHAERRNMISSCFKTEDAERLLFVPVRDYIYNDNTWIAEIQQKVKEITKESKSIIMVGSRKDKSSYYLDLFPQWKPHFSEVKSNIHSTIIREFYFRSSAPIVYVIPHPVAKFLKEFRSSDRYKELQIEQRYYDDYKAQWSGPFPITFVTTDVVIVKSGHVLLVRRKVNPGKGLLALPGGFLNSTEWIKDGAFREVKEETKIKLSQRYMKDHIRDEKLFDHPDRSLRGRTITQAFYVRLPDGGEMPEVKGGDDAAHAFWMPIGDLYINETEIFEDHLSIINYFINKG